MARQPCAHCQSARGLNPNDRFLAGRCNVNPHGGSVAERGLVIRLTRGTAATLLAPRASRVGRGSTDRDIERRCPAPIDSTSFFGVAPYWTGQVAHRFARMLRLPALISPGSATSPARRRAPLDAPTHSALAAAPGCVCLLMCGVHYFNAADLSVKSSSVATVRPAAGSAGTSAGRDGRRTPHPRGRLASAIWSRSVSMPAELIVGDHRIPECSPGSSPQGAGGMPAPKCMR